MSKYYAVSWSLFWLLSRLHTKVLCISWVCHSPTHVKYSTSLSYVRVLCLCSSSCSGKRRFWPRVSKFAPRSRCTGGLVVRISALREGRINSLLCGFRCVGISTWGELWVRLLFPVVVFRLGFLTLGISYLSVSWALPVLVWVSKFPDHKPSLTCLHAQLAFYDSCYLVVQVW